MEHYLLEQGKLDENMIRQWAFDTEAEFMEQDEDLVLHNWRFSDVILELAADKSCPKANYIIDIWDYFCRHTTIHQIPADIEAAYIALKVAEKYCHHIKIKQWIVDQTLRMEYIKGKGPVDKNSAMMMSENLLNGASRSCPIAMLRETDANYLTQLSVPNGSHKEWLLINKLTGQFRYSRHWPEWPKKSNEPQWFQFQP
jgi:hypothetical protein